VRSAPCILSKTDELRVAFVTRGFGTGNLRSWPNAPASATTGREAGDGICQAEADAAGLKGTFVALLSSNTVAQGRYDAGLSCVRFDGKQLPNCGQPSLPVDQAPWLSLERLPNPTQPLRLKTARVGQMGPATVMASASHSQENTCQSSIRTAASERSSWRRLDDSYPLATPAQLILDRDQHLTTPMLYAAGTRVVKTSERIWMGTGWNFTGNLTCSDGSLTTADGYSGVATAITSGWSLFTTIAGTKSPRVYCFES